MKRGSRPELVSELRELAEGWRHFGKEDRAAKADELADGLEAGSCSVRVGGTVYEVLEESSDG